MEAFRIVDVAYAAAAFNGEGARRAGGRWNSPGVSVVYTACHRSLAMLEMLVHLEDHEVLADFWRIIPVTVRDEAVEMLRDVPSGFADFPAPEVTRTLGDTWQAQNRSVGLRVPSAVARGEFNLLLNPLHPQFPQAVIIGDPEPLQFDARLARGGAR